jgi:hypothetical protein
MPADIQVFQPDELVFFNKLAAYLVMKVTALIGNPFIQPCQAQASLFSVTAAWLLAGQLACEAAALLLRFPVVLWWCNLFSAGQGRKIPQPQVNANRSTQPLLVMAAHMIFACSKKLCWYSSRHPLFSRYWLSGYRQTSYQ